MNIYNKTNYLIYQYLNDNYIMVRWCKIQWKNSCRGSSSSRGSSSVRDSSIGRDSKQ